MKIRPLTLFYKNRRLGTSEWLSWLSDQLLIMAQVMISQFMNWIPMLGSGWTVQSVLGILSPSLCSSPTCVSMLSLKINELKNITDWVAWVAQLVERPNLAQVMVLWFVSSGPALDSVSPSLSASLSLSLPFSQKLINIKKIED